MSALSSLGAHGFLKRASPPKAAQNAGSKGSLTSLCVFLEWQTPATEAAAKAGISAGVCHAMHRTSLAVFSGGLDACQHWLHCRADDCVDGVALSCDLGRYGYTVITQVHAVQVQVHVQRSIVSQVGARRVSAEVCPIVPGAGQAPAEPRARPTNSWGALRLKLVERVHSDGTHSGATREEAEGVGRQVHLVQGCAGPEY